MALAKTTEPLGIPADLAPLVGRCRLAIVLVRYESGTLRYDEFALGSLVRRGHRIGLLIHRIWVDDPASLWGGRRLWGIPKELARFRWDASTVTVRTAEGPLAAFTVGARPAWRLPVLLAPLPAFGQLDGERVLLPGRAVARFGVTSVVIDEWSAALPALIGKPRLRASTADPCRFTFPAGRVLGRAAATEAWDSRS
ncbi:acetoacetate decarboxylase family protein [Streptomyces sp. NPDC054933]